MLSDEFTSSLTVAVNITDGTAVISFRGDLDITARSAVSEQLAEIMQKKPERLIFDLAGVGIMDCATARAIFSAARLLPDGQRPVICSANPLVRRLLELTDLDAQCTLDGQLHRDPACGGAQVLGPGWPGTEPHVQTDGAAAGPGPDFH